MILKLQMLFKLQLSSLLHLSMILQLQFAMMQQLYLSIMLQPQLSVAVVNGAVAANCAAVANVLNLHLSMMRQLQL